MVGMAPDENWVIMVGMKLKRRAIEGYRTLGDGRVCGQMTICTSYCAAVALDGTINYVLLLLNLKKPSYSTCVPERWIGIIGPNETVCSSTREQYRF